MKLHVKIQREADPILVRMAKEAGVGVGDIVEIAVYNLIAVYLKEKGENVTEMDVSLPVSPVSVSHVGAIAGV